jgi:hypothetical protein
MSIKGSIKSYKLFTEGIDNNIEVYNSSMQVLNTVEEFDKLIDGRDITNMKPNYTNGVVFFLLA